MRFAVIVLTALMACACQEPQAPVSGSGFLIPVATFTHSTQQGPAWATVGSVDARPVLLYVDNSRPTLILTCQNSSMTVQARDFEPEQAWPQPKLDVRFGEVLRSATPDVRNIGDQVAFETAFKISDAVLAEIAQGTGFEVVFNNHKATFPAPLEADRKLFAQRCARLVPPPLRADA